MAAIVQKYPGQFAGMANVPMQDPEAAVKELEYAIKQLKLTGVEIASNINGKYLADPSFFPFFQKAGELDVPVYIHPVNPAGSDKMRDYYFMNLLGFPLETTMTACGLIFSGIMEKLPGLKILLSHAGGYLPYIIGRVEHGFKVRPECQGVISKSPVDYMKLFYYDTITHGTNGLRFLISTVGADHVLLGTDYPYDMGDFVPLKSVDAVPGLSAADRAKIVGGNAKAIFKLSG
jgi:aminocarboxymuconate-semialdehyde decarboxylase